MLVPEILPYAGARNSVAIFLECLTSLQHTRRGVAVIVNNSVKQRLPVKRVVGAA